MTTEADTATLGSLNDAEDLLVRGELPAAWDGAMACLETRPYHPDAFLLMEKIALAAGDLETARGCAVTASQMAPGRQPSRTLPAAQPSDGSPIWPGAHFVPPKQDNPSLSVCMIVKNEEQFLGRCLKSVRAIASQIVVVDTGSTDRTADIARQEGAEVYAFAWCDDFSAARNASLLRARGDWILILDADEELSQRAADRLRQELKNPAAIGYVLPLVDDGKEHEGCSYVPRLFRNFPGACFQGRVHEQVFPIVQQRALEWGLQVLSSEALLLHHGYTAQMITARNKSDRNLRLLRQAAREQPDDPNILLNLGLENARIGNLAEGLDYYRQSLALANRVLQKGGVIRQEFRAALLQQMATYLTRARNFAEVIELFKSPLAQGGDLSASDHYALGLACWQLDRLEQAAQEFRSCLAKRDLPSRIPVKVDLHGPRIHCCLALVLTRLGRSAEAEATYQQGLLRFPDSPELRLPYAQLKHALGRSIEALKDLHQLIKSHSSNPEVWAAGAAICLADPRFYEIALDWTAEAIRLHPRDERIAAQRAKILELMPKHERNV